MASDPHPAPHSGVGHVFGDVRAFGAGGAGGHGGYSNEEGKGHKNDLGKPRMELLDPGFMFGMARVLTFGAKKYEPHQWRRGMPYGRLAGAILRHVWAWIGGEDLDPETGEHHLLHAGCEVMFAWWMATHRQACDDRYKEGA